MQQILRTSTFILLILQLLSCKGQSNQQINTLSDDFDKSLPLYYGMPEQIDSRDTSPVWNESGQKLLLTGTVYQNDGKSPAPNILIYYYQTDTDGLYIHKENEIRSMPPNNLGQTHGYIRGWIKTDHNGEYAIYTIKPGSYPSRQDPAHIHVNIKEPNLKSQYYIDNFVFDDDKLLSPQKRNKLENRGGSGILKLITKGELQIGKRDIILGLNVKGYSEL